MWARNQRCTVPTRQSGIFFRRLSSAAKIKIASEIAPKARPSGVPPTVWCSVGVWISDGGR